jgi:Arc/MetJ-type ribon-helix-helix transcriptional regulator
MRKLAATAAPYEGRRLSVNLTRTQSRAIDELLATGLFGFNRSDLVRRLIDEKLRALVLEGWIAMPRGKR